MTAQCGAEGQEGPRCPIGLSGPAGTTLPGQGPGLTQHSVPERAPLLRPVTTRPVTECPRHMPTGGCVLAAVLNLWKSGKKSMQTGKLLN